MKFAFTGPESTGKSAVAQEVASFFSHFNLQPELARLYLEETKNSRLSMQEFIKICNKSAVLFEKSYENSVLFDTDMFVLWIWNSKEFNVPIPEIDRLCQIHFDHHFLCKPDFPWVADPLRYGGTQEERELLFEEYEKTLISFNAPYTILSGSLENKIQTAIRKIKELENG